MLFCSAAASAGAPGAVVEPLPFAAPLAGAPDGGAAVPAPGASGGTAPFEAPAGAPADGVAGGAPAVLPEPQRPVSRRTAITMAIATRASNS